MSSRRLSPGSPRGLRAQAGVLDRGIHPRIKSGARKRGQWPGVFLIIILGTFLPHLALAQRISIDGRFSPAQTLVGPNYTIGANLGKKVGGNLFHSFGTFGLAQGESATFSGPNTISNIIGRVTGGTASSVDGAIKSSIQGANLYLINPSGVVFGPHATVNVSGAFHVSTADYLTMADGARFQATNPGGSTLSAAPPTAFGFLTAAPAAITVNGSQLGPVPGTFGVVGGPVTIAKAATLSAPAGTIHVASAAGPGEVPVDPAKTSALTVPTFGPVNITGGSKLDVSDKDGRRSGGSVFIRAGDLTINTGEINADNYGPGAGGQLLVQAGGQITLTGANVHADSRAAGDGGTISVAADALSLTDGAGIRSRPFAAGNGGRILVTAEGLLTIDGSGSAAPTNIATTAQRGSSGNAGDITINAGAIALANPVAVNGGALIVATTNGPGNAGAITITTGKLTITGGADANQASIAAGTFGAGQGGVIRVSDTGLLSLDNGGISVFSNSGTGNAGKISITAETVSDVNNSFISAITENGSGNAGSVSITAQTLSVVNNGRINAIAQNGFGKAGDIAINVAGQLTVDGGAAEQAFIWAQSIMNSGDAGHVAIHAGDLAIIGGGFVSAGVCNCASGNGGTVIVDVDGTLTIDGKSLPAIIPTSPKEVARLPTGIAVSSAAGSVGNAGTVTVNAGVLNILANGVILSSTIVGAQGNGGDVVVNARRLTIDGTGATSGPDFFPTGISAETCCSGHAGRIMVNADSLSILNGGVISSGTAGSGNGGDVRVNADTISLSGPGPQITALSTGSGNAGSLEVAAGRLSLFDGASISTAAATANGGNIRLSVGDLLYLRGSSITTSVGGAFGNGGNIAIDPQVVVLDKSQIIAQAVRGHGGDIAINAKEFIASPDSLVSASSQLGISGTVEIIGPRVDLNGSLVVLASELRHAAEVLRNSCAAKSGLPRSSLTQAGRGGLPQDPEATIPALYLAGRDVDRSFAAASPLPRVARHATARLVMRCND